jgi:hypothetical protein
VLKRAVLGGKACPPIQQSTACLNLPKCPFLQVFDAELAVLKGGAWFDTVVINIFYLCILWLVSDKRIHRSLVTMAEVTSSLARLQTSA